MKLVFKYLKHNVRRCLEFYLVWVFVHFKLYDSKQRDPCEIAQTHMLSWAFSDHICRKYQQAIYEIPWYQFIGGTAQVDFMFGFDCKQNKTVNFPSLHGSVFEFCNDRTEYLRRIGDIGV